MDLSLQSVVRRNDALPSAPVDEEMVVLHLEHGSYFGFDAVGRRVWELLEQPSTVLKLCERLLEEFDVDESTCRSDVLGYVAELRNAGLVTVS